jgi:periplasmic protein CpxP/Spy
MKTSIHQLAFLSLILTLPLTALKAEAPATEGKSRQEMTEKIKERVQHMKQELGLSDEQAGKITVIMNEQAAALKPLRENKTLSKEQRRTQMMEIHKASADKIKALLTPEQAAKHEVMRKEHMEKMKDYMRERKQSKS